MSKLPINQIRRSLDGAARDNYFYQYLLDALVEIEELEAKLDSVPVKEARKGQMAMFSEAVE